jgi:hypothetical protein
MRAVEWEGADADESFAGIEQYQKDFRFGVKTTWRVFA